jgi:hypothetical protein
MLTLPRFACALALAVSVTACGGGGNSNPTSPSTPQYPNVAGNYSGSTVMAFPELGQQVSCQTTTSITQSGSSISIAPLVLGGECGGMSIPAGPNTIDTTGALTGSGGAYTFDQPSCGRSNANASGGFFGREFRLSINSTSSTCYNLNMTIRLTR